MPVDLTDREPSIRLPQEIIAPGLHVDLKFSGAILASMDGQTYESITSDQLRHELQAVKDAGTFVLYTREYPDREPPEHLMNTFEIIADSGVPIRMLEPDE
jgi:hypothetical protein